MGRRPNYQREAVLRASAALFRVKGFHGVSVEDIVETTGLNRFALYEKFGSKEELFYATLQFYHQVMVKQEFLGPLCKDSASLSSVISRLRALQRMNLNPEIRPGCLVVNANIELGGKDERVAAEADCVRTTFREAFEHALTRAQQRGELSGARSAADCASYVALMLQAFFSLGYLSRDAAAQLMARLLEEVDSWKEPGGSRGDSQEEARLAASKFQNARAGIAG
jgi:TetR/AcrR family transcriptional repressor of nem operon